MSCLYSQGAEHTGHSSMDSAGAPITMADEQEPFLEKIDDSGWRNGTISSTRNWLANHKRLVMAHVLLLVAYTIGSLVIVRSQSCVESVYHTAFDGLRIQSASTKFHRLNASSFVGDPSIEIDAAWDELLKPMHMRVSKDELYRDNQRSVAFPEGGGYLGWMGVFHELHCIRMLREWNHPDYYHADMTTAEAKHMQSHVDHCFDFLRQAALCHADTSLTTFKWHPEKPEPMFNASESIHSCIDWDALMESSSWRVVEEKEVSRLSNPLQVDEKIFL